MDQLLADAGLGWALRRMAKSMDYGTGKTFSTVTQDEGDLNRMKIVMEFPGAKVPTIFEFVTGEPGWQETVGGGEGPMLIKAAWDGPVLVLEAKLKAGKAIPTSRRWVDLASDELKISIRNSKGDDVIRVFSRR